MAREAPVADIVSEITKIAARARKYRESGLGEQNTKASLVEPVLEALGWDTRDPDEVHREFRPTGRDCPVDYALKLVRKPRLFLEAKGLGETLADRKWITQVLSYATVAGVEWCVLTDGDEFRFYNASAPVDAAEKMFCSVRLTAQEPAEAARTLSLMSRANLQDNLLEMLWTSHFVDRKVKAALQELVASPGKVLVGVLRQRASSLSARQIADSVRRLEIKIDSPVAIPPVAKRPAATRPGRGETLTQGKRSGGALDVTLQQLISAGLIRPPFELTSGYRGRTIEARVEANGDVTFAGVTYASCSTAASAAIATVIGRRKPVNGWDFWKFSDEGGRKLPLSVLRTRASASKEGSPSLRLA